MWRLVRWADDGDRDILRVNAAGVLAKTGSLDSAGLPAAVQACLQGSRAAKHRGLTGRAATV